MPVEPWWHEHNEHATQFAPPHFIKPPLAHLMDPPCSRSWLDLLALLPEPPPASSPASLPPSGPRT